MRPTLLPLLLAGALAIPAAAAAQTARISAAEIDGHIRFLSSDLLEGRAPATRGGAITTAYIASQLRAAGVEPGTPDGYFQRVPIDVVAAQAPTMRIAASGRATATLRHPEDVVVWAGAAVPRSGANAELVFVGYGASAPEYRWDDFKDVDVRGKILVVLVNDPPAPANEPALFGGRGMTYYGRWTYKFEEAERRGAAGMLIVHATEPAGYPWHTVVGSWSIPQRMLPRDTAATPKPLGFRGWITDTAATALFRQAGLDLAELTRRAARRDFRPVSTGITLDVSFENRSQRLESDNVVGVVRGADPALRDEYVAYSAHWDHLGIGPAVDGDSIYNGAIDNASGVADLLAVARAAASMPPTKRSLLFVFVTAEESGLLGSDYFARNPTVPLERIVANVNVDGGNVLGRVRSFRVLGDDRSTLGPAFAAFVQPQGWRLEPDARPERGYFYRSDHFAFARLGVPAVSIGVGQDFEGRPAGWGEARANEYNARSYHQPSDEYDPAWDLSGAVQLSEAALGFGRWLADAPSVPAWNATSEFRPLRPGPATPR